MKLKISLLIFLVALTFSCASSYKTSIQKSDKVAALDAVNSIKDTETLKDVATKAYFSVVRSEALKKIEDQDFLKDRFKKERKTSVKFLLANKITDKKFHAEQVMNKYLPESIRMIFAKKIQSQDVLIKIVRTTRNMALARYAAGKITVENAGIILNSIRDSNYLGSVTIPILMSRIKNIDQLKAFARNRNSYKVRREAKKRVRSENYEAKPTPKDLALFKGLKTESEKFKFVKSSRNRRLRMHFISTTANQDHLKYFSKSRDRREIKAAIKRITDQDFLYKLALNRNFTAFNRLNDPKYLLKLHSDSLVDYRYKEMIYRKLGKLISVMDRATKFKILKVTGSYWLIGKIVKSDVFTEKDFIAIAKTNDNTGVIGKIVRKYIRTEQGLYEIGMGGAIRAMVVIPLMEDSSLISRIEEKYKNQNVSALSIIRKMILLEPVKRKLGKLKLWFYLGGSITHYKGGRMVFSDSARIVVKSGYKVIAKTSSSGKAGNKEVFKKNQKIKNSSSTISAEPVVKEIFSKLSKEELKRCLKLTKDKFLRNYIKNSIFFKKG